MAESPHKSSSVEPCAGSLGVSQTGSDVAAASTDIANACAGAGLSSDGSAINPLTNDSLVNDSLTNDSLVDRHYAVVYRYAYRLAGCVWAAEDITQETFVQAIVHRQQLRVAEAERGWVLSIARRAYMRWLRRKSRATYGQPLAEAGGEQDVWQRLPDERATTVEQQTEHEDWLQSALAALGEDAKLVLVMYYFEELSYAEIAQQLQIPIGTVMSRLSRARGHLRAALQQADQPQTIAISRRLDSANAAHVAWPTDLPSKPLGQEATHG